MVLAGTQIVVKLFPATDRGLSKVLKLSDSGIQRVDRKAFLNLGTSLEQLDLSGNRLQLLEEETLRPLYGLQARCYPPPTTSYRPQTTDNRLQTTVGVLPNSGGKP